MSDIKVTYEGKKIKVVCPDCGLHLCPMNAGEGKWEARHPGPGDLDNEGNEAKVKLYNCVNHDVIVKGDMPLWTMRSHGGYGWCEFCKVTLCSQSTDKPGQITHPTADQYPDTVSELVERYRQCPNAGKTFMHPEMQEVKP